MKKNLLIFLPFLVILLSACSFNVNINSNPENDDEEVSTLAPKVSDKEEEDEAEIELEEVADSEALTIEGDEVLIGQAMADKLGRDIQDLIVTIETNTGTHASGGVKEKGAVAGGYFFAAKVSGDWIIAADGSGVIICSDIEPYNFPTSMIAECWDETLSKSVSR